MLLDGMVWSFDRTPGEKLIQRALGFMTYTEGLRFNDSPDTTHEMLLARLDAGIAKLEAGG